MIGIAVGSTAIEYEYEYRFAEYEYERKYEHEHEQEQEHDEMRWNARIPFNHFEVYLLQNLFTTK
jgi:hypothetical protein